MEKMINKIFQGDCKDIMKIIPNNCISSCITDPPYNYEFIGHNNWDENEINRRKEKANAPNSSTLVKNIPYGSGLSGGIRNERWYKKNRNNILEYQKWCLNWGLELFRICKPGASIVIFNSTRTIAHVQVALEEAGFYTRDIMVYRRHSGIPKGLNLKKKLENDGIIQDGVDGLHSCLRNEWEAICVLQKPLNNSYLQTYKEFGTGLFYTKTKDGGFRSNIIENIKKDINLDFNIHPTVKPLDLMITLLDIFAPKNPNSIILDPFAGSGTTLVAAKKLGIDFIGIEIESKYIEIAERRLMLP